MFLFQLEANDQIWRLKCSNPKLKAFQRDPCPYSLSQQVFEASVQFYVIFVQVTEELVGPQDFCNADQLENNIRAH